MSENRPTALIAVTRCVPGMIMSAMTQVRLFSEIGFASYLLVDEDLLSLMGDCEGANTVDALEQLHEIDPDVVLVNNVGLRSICLIHDAKRLRAKTFYILHEPYDGFGRILKEGPSRWLKAGGAYVVNAVICKMVDTVLLPSDLALQQYRNRMESLNSSYRKFPLFYSDPSGLRVDGRRFFFSFVGSFVDAHAADDFLRFVTYAVKADDDIRFQIATRSSIEEKLDSPEYRQLMYDGRLVVVEGRPLTEQEMSEAYLKSICCWCAYKVSTQSGVAISALQHGTPIIATRLGSMDACAEGAEFVSSSSAYQEILEAYKRIAGNLSTRVNRARSAYLKHFDYRSHLDLAIEVFANRDEKKQDRGASK